MSTPMTDAQTMAREIADRLCSEGYPSPRYPDGVKYRGRLSAEAYAGLVEDIASALTASPAAMEIAARNERQLRMFDWAQIVFASTQGGDAGFRAARARRFLEEAVELAQAIGVTAEEVTAIRDYVFGRSAGEPRQEIGGTMLTLNCLAQAVGVSVAEAEHAEWARVLAKPVTHFQQRDREKQHAGI